jgi:hypothetical protein
MRLKKMHVPVLVRKRVYSDRHHFTCELGKKKHEKKTGDTVFAVFGDDVHAANSTVAESGEKA